MTVYVDSLKLTPKTRSWPYLESCHLFADTIQELHDFARTLGLQRAWFQDKRLKHYDLTAHRREKAVKLGAIEVTSREMVEHVREKAQP